MFGIMGDPPKRAGRLMPPATTRRPPDRPAASTREARIIPPFIPSDSQTTTPPIDVEVAAPNVAAEPTEPVQPVEASFVSAEAEQPAAATESTDAEPADHTHQLDPWELSADAEGSSVASINADTDTAFLELMHSPESEPPAPQTTPATLLAERLEQLTQRLRVEDAESLVRQLAGGDRTDALLAGLLAGYLAGKSEQQ